MAWPQAEECRRPPGAGRGEAQALSWSLAGSTAYLHPVPGCCPLALGENACLLIYSPGVWCFIIAATGYSEGE